MTWVLLALLAALGAALTALAVKAAVDRGGALRSTVAYRAIAGTLLLALVAVTSELPAPSPAWWRAVGLVLPLEVIGTILFSLALGAGELSLVTPLMGTMPLFVAVAGAVVLREIPSAPAALGIACVAAGVYGMGLGAGTSPLAPLKALARSRASWYAMGAVLAWTFTAVGHKAGIAAVGPLPWGVTLAFGSALLLALALPLVRQRHAPSREPGVRGRWLVLVALAGACWALQQVGLQSALGQAQAGYVIALSASSTLLSVLLGIVVLGERASARARVLGGVLVTAGAALVALYG